MSTSSAENTAAAFAENRVELATFELHGQDFAIDVTQIREIVRAREVTPLPKAPELIEGVVDLRGTVVPVVDVCRSRPLHASALRPGNPRSTSSPLVGTMNGGALQPRLCEAYMIPVVAS